MTKKEQPSSEMLEDDTVPSNETESMSRQRCRWVCCTWLLTWYIPSVCLAKCGRMRLPEVRMAWREKLALCLIIALLCGIMLFFILVFGRLICPKQDVFSVAELAGKTDLNDPWVYAYGRAFQIKDLMANHLKSYGVETYQFAPALGTDVSYLFYKQYSFESYCPGLNPPQKEWDPVMPRKPGNAVQAPHKSLDASTGKPKLYLEYMNRFSRGRVGWSMDYVAKLASAERRIIVLYNNVYDVSGYFNAQNRFFGPYVDQLFANFYGRDATRQWYDVAKADPQAPLYLNCLNNLFYIGVVDTRMSFKCQFSNYIMLATSIFVVVVIGFKFLAALQFSGFKEAERNKKYVVVMIPCYTEGPESIGTVLESVAATDYEDKCKLLFLIVDGIVQGSGNERPTGDVVLEALGIDPSPPSTSDANRAAESESHLTRVPDPISKAYESLGVGDMAINYAKVYSGFYKTSGHVVPYILVIKTGLPSETSFYQGGKPGNRGKRDSQVMLMRFLSRVHQKAPMTPLELTLYEHLVKKIGIPPSYFEYVLMVDADTELMPDSLKQLISTMVHDSRIVGLCGEVEIGNAKDSFITMMQVYEYFIAHHLAKAFESMFGSVTCLPGCFCLYRIRSPKKNVPLLVSPMVVREYAETKVDTLHLKNLLQLGEDRYLTTLMMKHFPHMKLSFTPHAHCKTQAPDKFSVLLSQRRRWINSTVHNLVELLLLPHLCGFCCFSMRFIVFLDLFSTVVQPAGMLYMVYLIYSIVTNTDSIPVISLILIGAIYGFQVIIFLLKRQWAQIGWMVIYLLAMPIFGFYMPLYSFWHFDDFTWGNTRVVAKQMKRGDEKRKELIPMEKYGSESMGSLPIVSSSAAGSVVGSQEVLPDSAVGQPDKQDEQEKKVENTENADEIVAEESRSNQN